MLKTWELEPSIVMPFQGGSDHSNLVTGIVTRITGTTNSEARYQFDVPAIGLIEAQVDGPHSSLSMYRRAKEVYAEHTIRSLAIQIGPYFDANTQIADYDQTVLPSDLSPTFRAFHDRMVDVCVTELGYEKAMEIAREALEWNDAFDRDLPGLVMLHQEPGSFTLTNRLSQATVRIDGTGRDRVYTITAPSVTGGPDLDLTTSSDVEFREIYADLWLRRLAVLGDLADAVEDDESFTPKDSVVREVFGDLLDIPRVCGEYDEMIEWVLNFVDDPVAVIRNAEQTPERSPSDPARSPKPGF